jgi:Ni/Co efflux regulator RcnB
VSTIALNRSRFAVIQTISIIVFSFFNGKVLTFVKDYDKRLFNRKGINHMNRHILPLIIFSTLMVLSTGHSVAKDHESHGKHKSEKHEKKHKHDNDIVYQNYFSNDRQVIIKNYYVTTRDAKHCPPGLKKKRNACYAPGYAKKWHKGQHLPADVVYYDVPPALTLQLGLSSKSQKIVRVGTDLLLISIGTGMVIDAIDDLNGAF